ncbi:MAG TPA: CHASE3 domain-containing protein [Chthoniobacterales bacterium]|nr:CHASE3 domain-containing protein [Chthoniobacterales bacterium]
MKWALGKAATAGFGLMIAALLTGGWLSSRNLQRLARNEALVVHTHEVLDQVRDVLMTLADAESGQRSYILTGQADYLEGCRAAFAEVASHLDRARALTVDNPVQQTRLARLAPMVSDRLASLQKGIALRDQEGPESGQRYVLAGRGKRQMDSIRRLIAEIEKSEEDLLKIREDESRISHRTAWWTQWMTTALGLGLVVAAYALIVREVASRRRGAEALARANDELEARVEARTVDLAEAIESLRRSNRELEQFASVASHDLQEPLRKIQAFGDRLQTRCAPELGEQGRDYLTRMLASAGRMRSLIDALLTFSRVTTKAQAFVPVDLAATVADVVSDLEAQMQRTGGRVEIGPLATLEADPLQMRQLIQNLIGNALKFTRPGEPPAVRIESRLLPAEDGAEGVGPCCEITVSDNGIGFEEVYLDRIFELFQRLHGRQEFEGTGMGLAICRKIVERHGGTITARSAPDHGATFLVTLPLRQQ